MGHAETRRLGVEAVKKELFKRGIESSRKDICIRTFDSGLDNDWGTKKGIGWDHINPKKFNYLICVAFNKKQFANFRFFIFTKEQSENFPETVWKNSPGLKVLRCHKNDKMSLCEVIELAENRWDKIK